MSSDASATRFFNVGISKVSVGRFSYGFKNITVKQWGEGASLEIGSFCSIASATIYLGGNHQVDWITTYPFGHIIEKYSKKETVILFQDSIPLNMITSERERVTNF